METKLDRYIGRAIIRYLNGDMKLFKYYKDVALELLEKEKEFVKVEDIIGREIKSKLYELVS